MPINGGRHKRGGEALNSFMQNLALKFSIAKDMLVLCLCIAIVKVLLRMFQNTFVSGSLEKIFILVRITVCIKIRLLLFYFKNFFQEHLIPSVSQCWFGRARNEKVLGLYFQKVLGLRISLRRQTDNMVSSPLKRQLAIPAVAGFYPKKTPELVGGFSVSH